MEYRNLTTPLLIDKCAERDGLAWAEFVRRFSPLITFSIKKALSRYTGTSTALQEEIKDIRQNIMVALWGKNKLDEVRQKENINYWLAITARNATINHLKAGRKEVLITDESYFEELPAKDAGQKTGEIEDADKKIKGIYKLLTPREKLIFNLYFKKNIKTKDIAGILNISIGSVTSAITRMRQKIRSKI